MLIIAIVHYIFSLMSSQPNLWSLSHKQILHLPKLVCFFILLRAQKVISCSYLSMSFIYRGLKSHNCFSFRDNHKLLYHNEQTKTQSLADLQSSSIGFDIQKSFDSFINTVIHQQLIKYTINNTVIIQILTSTCSTVCCFFAILIKMTMFSNSKCSPDVIQNADHHFLFFYVFQMYSTLWQL